VPLGGAVHSCGVVPEFSPTSSLGTRW
jgi:hypothetical protein